MKEFRIVIVNQKDNSNRKHALILFMIVVLGSFFAFAGAGWGLPALLHPDEGVIVETAINMLKNKTFEPDVFYRPDHLLIQINVILYKIIVFLGRTSIEELSIARPEVFYLAARIITACFAVGATILAFLIGRKSSRATGLVCAFLFAFYPLYVAHSHFASPDIPTTFCMLLFILASYNYLKNPSTKQLFIMSLSVSAFIAIKYPGAILFIMIAINIVFISIKEKQYFRILRHGLLAIVFVIGLLFVISPVLFINFAAVRYAFMREAGASHLGADGLGMGGNALFYVTNFISTSGIILFLFFICGIYFIFKRKIFRLHFPLFYGLIYWVCMSGLELHWERWALPMYVTPLLIAAIGITSIYNTVNSIPLQSRIVKPARIALSTALCIVALNFLSGAIAVVVSHSAKDTRVVSHAYCEENGITQSNTVYEGYSPLNPGFYGEISDRFVEQNGAYFLRQSRIEYIILSSTMYARFMAEPEKYPVQNAIYRDIQEGYTLINQLNGTYRRTSPIDVVNIVENFSYFHRMAADGLVGPELLFYRSAPENYIVYSLSSPIQFGSLNDSFDNYYVRGDNKLNEDSVLIQDKETEFLFYLPESGSDLSLSVNVAPHPDQTDIPVLAIEVNGNMVGKIEIDKPGEFSVEIPGSIIGGNTLKLKLLLNTDSTESGFFIYEMTIDELGH